MKNNQGKPFNGQNQKEVYVRLGERIRRRREALGMSQVELSRRIGLSVTRIQACEHGRHTIRITLIAALAKALDISPSYLLEDEKVARSLGQVG